jgi:hypothetical protein
VLASATIAAIVRIEEITRGPFRHIAGRTRGGDEDCLFDVPSWTAFMLEQFESRC